ncbi:MAG: RidA family protein [Vampirovibrionales bacterium]|nr:RidA family protein [Vampirovibrionales bacterium]
MTLELTQKTLADWEAELPAPPVPVAAYVPTVQTGQLVFTSGVLPMKAAQVAFSGQLSAADDNAVAMGYEAAQLCLLNALSLLKAHLGSLSRIRRIVKLVGFVSSTPDFFQQPQVINGASNLLVDIFGDAIESGGKHARSAVGVAALPLNASVELELIVEVSP